MAQDEHFGESEKVDDIMEAEFEAENEGDEGLPEPEPKIDLNRDPFQSKEVNGPGENWEKMIRSVAVKKPAPPSSEEQRNQINWILNILDCEEPEPSESQVKEALNWLENI
jgi:hypothetical protein